MKKIGLLAAALLLALLATLGYYWYTRPAAPVNVALRPEREPLQGLTGVERGRYYHLTMGGELLPLVWLQALESAQTGQPFLADIERFGLLPDADDSDGLPIGLTAAPSRDARFAGKMVGLNCAACHIGEMTYQGKSVRLEGAPGLFNGEAFVKDLLESLGATVQSPHKLFAFIKHTFSDKEMADQQPGAHRLFTALAGLEDLTRLGALEKGVGELFEKVYQSEQARPAFALENGLSTKGGWQPWRTELPHDDLKDLLNKPAGTKGLFAVKETRESTVRQALDHFVATIRLLKARIAFAKKLHAEQGLNLPVTLGGPGRVDDFGAARNLLFDAKDARPLTAPCSIPHLWGIRSKRWTDWDGNTQSAQGRSLATALAAGAVFDPKSYRSTVEPRNLAELDQLSEKITPPSWPEAIFGNIDAAKAMRGAKLYEQHCVRCHVDPKQAAEGETEKLFSVQEIGTDPERVQNFALPMGDRPFAEAVQATIERYLHQANQDAGIDAEEAKKLEAGHPNVWRTTGKYAAGPLASIWATAPYLHNGSVPTLYDLLLPAAKRPKAFPLGHRDYDPTRLGYTTEVTVEPLFIFDTTLRGNRNTGHEFGTELPEVQRLELLEYFKGL